MTVYRYFLSVFYFLLFFLFHSFLLLLLCGRLSWLMTAFEGMLNISSHILLYCKHMQAWATSWSGWRTTAQRKLLRTSSALTRSATSTAALWLVARVSTSTAQHPVRNFATSSFKLLTRHRKPFASLMSPCTTNVSWLTDDWLHYGLRPTAGHYGLVMEWAYSSSIVDK